MQICFLTKIKRELANIRPSLHFYGMIFWWKKESLQRNGTTAIAIAVIKDPSQFFFRISSRLLKSGEKSQLLDKALDSKDVKIKYIHYDWTHNDKKWSIKCPYSVKPSSHLNHFFYILPWSVFSMLVEHLTSYVQPFLS